MKSGAMGTEGVLLIRLFVFLGFSESRRLERHAEATVRMNA